MSIKIFTLEEANRVLPTVREAVVLARAKVEEIVGIQDRLSVLSLIGAGDSQSPEHREFDENQEQLETLVRAYNKSIEQLQTIGCVLKDLNHGLVDFYARKGNRLVFLCWRLGEKEIAFWHELKTGFTGRRPVSELDEEGKE
jgi:hypothetical protein